MFIVLTNAVEDQVEELKYVQKSQMPGLGEITFMSQGGKVPDRKKVRELQSDFQWNVAADSKAARNPFPSNQQRSQTW